jgi:arginine deiminase
MPARSRETQLTELIYGAHPRFTGTPRLHGWRNEHVEGGDVLLLAPGVLAIGVGERTTPAGAPPSLPWGPSSSTPSACRSAAAAASPNGTMPPPLAWP